MWMIAAFDIPNDPPEGAKEYRLCRKCLDSMDFLLCQKSVAVKWFDCDERALAAKRRLQAVVRLGKLFCWCISDTAFQRADWQEAGSPKELPFPPSPAIVL